MKATLAFFVEAIREEQKKRWLLVLKRRCHRLPRILNLKGLAFQAALTEIAQ